MNELKTVLMGDTWWMLETSEKVDSIHEYQNEKLIDKMTGKVYERSISPGSATCSLEEWLHLIEKSSRLSIRHEESQHRRAYRVLSMVRCLHEAGYQKLRIVPGMSPSGFWWRCLILPSADVLASNGALCREDADWSAAYSSAHENSFFGWEDAKDDSASELAAKFMQRFPGIVLHGKGRDWAYAGWYLEMLGYAHEGGFPVAYDTFMDDIPEGFMKLTDGRTCLPLPPGGMLPILTINAFSSSINIL